MKLVSFRVTDFRSVADSGWIEVDELTALIGTNESGKTNLLLPLWKLRPAKEGQINVLADMPRHRYHEMRDRASEVTFIEARFELSPQLQEELAELTNSPVEGLRVAEVGRRFDGTYTVGFPEAKVQRAVASARVKQILEQGLEEINKVGTKSSHEAAIKSRIIEALGKAISDLPNSLGADELADTINIAGSVKTGNAPSSSSLVPKYESTVGELSKIKSQLGQPHPSENQEARNIVVSKLPSFVYYSNYGNLDSEIYLPHVIDNLKRSDLGQREEAKARTLKVLFDFVRLNPTEILELGQDFEDKFARSGQQAPRPSDDQIRQISEKKKEREVLLKSASVDLTRKFRDWWQQGEYQFKFQADGDHFRIWVSDDKRPEDIELEGRSTGLQWFLSFYLIFLVESQDSHEGAILLLDEPGLSLHPIAQRDLSGFFETLSKTNQLIYTTHSPFMVNSDHLDRVRAVYVDEAGKTAVAEDLMASMKQKDQINSIYLIDAALGISASEGLMYGAQVVIVEGTSDQMYLTAIKSYLIGQDLISPTREIIFVTAGGTRGVKSVAGIFAGRDGTPPYIILDGDTQGKALASNLSNSDLYSEASGRIIVLSDLIGMEGAEVEDLWPFQFISDVVSRYLRGPEMDFDAIAEEGKPIGPQVEAYAEENGLDLEQGYKVVIAKQAKARLLNQPSRVDPSSKEVQKWKELFERLMA